MRWAKSEYILKGVFLGLLVFVSLQQNLNWEGTGRIALWLMGGFALALILAAAKEVKSLKGLGRNPFGFFLFLLLENPFLIYAGLVLGFLGGAIAEKDLPDDPMIAYCVCCGAILGYALGELRELTRGFVRLGLSAALCAGVGAALYFWLQDAGLLEDPTRRTLLGVHLLLGIPFFYLLVFCGMAEESEVEIAALCATFGLGLWLIPFPSRMPAIGLLLPVGLYCVYTIRILGPLRVFKHTLRGYGHNQIGHVKAALASYNRALQLDPKNHMARNGLIRLHRGLDVQQLDDATRGLLNPNLCVGEAAKILVGPVPPTPEGIQEATGLLAFVAEQWPAKRGATDYYQAVADTHAGHLDAAVDRLANLLDPAAWPPVDPSRDSILFDAWQLALRTHPELKRRGGDVQLPLPGRRVEAIRAVSRKLAKTPDDLAVRDFRDDLFAGLTAEEYSAAAAAGPPDDFDYVYAEELGLRLIAAPDQWQRGALYLRVAGHGLPHRGPAIFQRLADVAEGHGERAAARRYRQLVRESGQAVGPSTLEADQKTIYFATLKKLGESAAADRDWKEAIANYTLYAQAETSGKETLRTLAQMYENDGHPLHALKLTEDALTRGADKDLTERKDKYYYSVEPEHLKAQVDEVRGHFDVKYCVKKAKQLLDSNSPELDVLDWATHLAKLALVMEPKNLMATVQLARCHLRRGERDDGLRLLEDVREMKPSGGEEREAREWTVRQLGGLYLDEYSRPDLAIECLKEFLDSEKSGARTLYDLGRAYEAQGNSGRAAAYYEQTASYQDNPIRWEAEEALRRVKGAAVPPG